MYALQIKENIQANKIIYPVFKEQMTGKEVTLSKLVLQPVLFVLFEDLNIEQTFKEMTEWEKRMLHWCIQGDVISFLALLNTHRLSIILNGESGKDIIMAVRMHSWFNVNVKVNENT